MVLKTTKFNHNLLSIWAGCLYNLLYSPTFQNILQNEMVNFKKQSILDMFNMYSHKIQQNLMQVVKLHEIIVKNKVTPTL
jgi:DNA-directed RNA polymerase